LRSEERARDGVEHFVRDQCAVDRGRQLADPRHAILMQGRAPTHGFALARRQIRADFEDRIARRQRVARRERAQEIGGEPSAPSAQLHDLAAPRRIEDRRHLVGQCSAEQRRHLRGRDEVAGCPSLVAPPA
jgi:hypothetical protein